MLVHGASHGGWCFDRVAAILRAEGHRVLAPTLAGVGERAGMDACAITLSTHVDEIVELIEREALRDVILCGHSYGGMVITAVAERIAPRLAALVYLDAVVPEDGQCMNELVFPGWRLLPVLIGVWLFGRGCRLTPPPPARFFKVNEADRAMVDGRLTSHPWRTLTERIRLTGQADRVARHVYVYATKWGNRQIARQYAAARARPGWSVFEVASGHDMMIDAPGEVARILLEQA